ncbi:MAG: cytochrome bc1 complex cytochrome b subunit [Carbonactinosporaceae bacterium]
MSSGETPKAAAAAAEYLDERASIARLAKASLRKVFPDHWSFLLGEIALYSFIVLVLSGTFLTFFFTPSVDEVVYHGSYVPLRGVEMSEAFASTLDISFDVRGGLLMRQIHHWSAVLFVAAIVVHMLRIFFTGAFRKPRELNWLIGNALLTLALLEGFAGYSLPDDLLSGTGLRIAEGVILSVPVVGTYASFFLFGGQFPGDEFIPRLFTVHILIIPAILVALITVHLFLIVYQKHTQYPGAGRTDRNAVGQPALPVYAAKAGGFFFAVFGACALLGGLTQINPIWLYGPYEPTQITAGSQPDWYIGFLEGALRAMPNWEVSAFGHTLMLNVLVPAVIVPGLMFTLLALYPFLESWVRGDRREHHILDRPRNQPTRTGLGVLAITFYCLLWMNGGNDVIAATFDLSINAITWFTRIALFVLPVAAFLVTRRICLGLQRRDLEVVLHGRESGIMVRMPDGEFTEAHVPLSAEQRWVRVQHEVPEPRELPPSEDEHGVARPTAWPAALRANLSRFYFGKRVDKPTRRDLEQAHEEGSEHEREEAARLGRGPNRGGGPGALPGRAPPVARGPAGGQDLPDTPRAVAVASPL